MPLRFIPLGTIIHNIEMKKDKGGQIAKSAGTGAQILAKEGEYAQVRLPSSEIRRSTWTAGRRSARSATSTTRTSTSARPGARRWMGRKPHVRGTAMNPVDHPHGGGEGKAKGGRHPVSPEGIPTKGYKTRRNKRTQVFIVRRRSK